MKLFLFLSLLTTTLSAKEINGVTICATECYTESLRIQGHDSAVVGKIYYADPTEQNRNNTLLCIDHSKTIIVESDRLSDGSLHSCIDALSGKYFGKIVNMKTDFFDPGDEVGAYFVIKEAK